jgi:predicted nuclease of predicted toxin-antitoxin system
LSPAALKFRAFLDAGVPDSVGRVFSEFGHTVIYHRNVLPDKTPDEAVCATALANEAILVAIDGDMKQMAKRYGVTPKGDRFDNLNIIRLACNEVLASKRLKHSISLILHEWAFCLEKPPRRLWVDVLPHQIRTHR